MSVVVCSFCSHLLRRSGQAAAERAAREHAENEARRARELRAAQAMARAEADEQARRAKQKRAVLTERRDGLQREIEAVNAEKLEVRTYAVRPVLCCRTTDCAVRYVQMDLFFVWEEQHQIWPRSIPRSRQLHQHCACGH